MSLVDYSVLSDVWLYDIVSNSIGWYLQNNIKDE